MNMMKMRAMTILVLAGVASGALIFQDNALAVKNKSAGEIVKRGEYLVNYGGCHDCHSPKVFTDKGPEPDLARALSGHPAGTKLPAFPRNVIGPDKWGALTTNDLTAWFGPWGVSFARNLTPDQETGLGGWSEKQFIDTMRTGKHLGNGREILPPMPWFALAALTDDDLKAIFSYLGTVPPIKNKVPDPLPPSE